MLGFKESHLQATERKKETGKNTNVHSFHPLAQSSEHEWLQFFGCLSVSYKNEEKITASPRKLTAGT